MYLKKYGPPPRGNFRDQPTDQPTNKTCLPTYNPFTIVTGAIHPGSLAPSYAWGVRGHCPLCTSPRYATDLGYCAQTIFAMVALCDGGPLPTDPYF